MSHNSRRTTAFALVAATALAGPPAAALTGTGASQPQARDDPGAAQDLPPAIDAFFDILDRLPAEQDREPAWRNPHASPRPSPDRDFVLPDLNGRSG
jgi:hypothetical protein